MVTGGTGVNGLNYYSLCHTDPKKWINSLKGNVAEPFEKHPEKYKISVDKLSCRSATEFFVKNKFVVLKAEHTIQLIQFIAFHLMLPKTLDSPFYNTKNSLHSTQDFFRDPIQEHDKCHLCGERQTLTHLFVTCSKAWLFWSLSANMPRPICISILTWL